MTKVAETSDFAPATATTSMAATSGARRAFWSQSRLFIVHVSGKETGEQLSVVEGLLPPAAMTPLHTLPRASQILYVLEGELTAYLPGLSRVLEPGDSMHQPAGIAQTHRVSSSTPARVLAITSPAGFERFFAETGQPTESFTLPPPDASPPDLAQLAAIAAKHGIEFLGPPGALPERGASQDQT